VIFLILAGGIGIFRLPAQSSEDEAKARFLQSKSSHPSSPASAESKASPTPRHAQGKNVHGKKHSSAHPSPTPHHSSGKKSHHHHTPPAPPSESHASEPLIGTSSSSEDHPAPIHHAATIPTEPAASAPIIPPRIPTVASPGDAPTLPVSLPATPPAAPPAETPSHLPHGATPSAPITISKSGAEPDQGIEPPPAPEASGGFFGWLFGGGSGGPSHSYSYLTAATRRAIDQAPVRHGRWKYIIVHNSGTREGNARVFNIYHLRVRHMKNGLAYHFVIGDGHGSGDGEIEIGHRWTAQLNGGHVASDYLNDISLGICLVGDFNRDLPTPAQISALEELISYLRNRVGKCQGHRAIIYAHKEINPRPTDCPGDRFPYSWLHGKFR